jgi:hypothetical protein
MNKIILSIIIVGLFISSAIAEGTNWVLVALAQDVGEQIYIDTSNVSCESDNIYRVWIKKVDIRKPEGGHLLSYVKYDCKESKYGYLQQYTYDKDGNIKSSDSFIDNFKWEYAPPETKGMITLNYVCSNKDKWGEKE